MNSNYEFQCQTGYYARFRYTQLISSVISHKFHKKKKKIGNEILLAPAVMICIPLMISSLSCSINSRGKFLISHVGMENK